MKCTVKVNPPRQVSPKCKEMEKKKKKNIQIGLLTLIRAHRPCKAAAHSKPIFSYRNPPSIGPMKALTVERRMGEHLTVQNLLYEDVSLYIFLKVKLVFLKVKQ